MENNFSDFCKKSSNSVEMTKIWNIWKRTLDKDYVRIFLAEFIASAIFIAYGDGSIAQIIIKKQPLNVLLINFGFAVGITIAIYISGAISGGHLNPAITLALCIFGVTPWRLLPIYWLAQYLGCFLGAALIHGMYIDAITTLDGGTRHVTGPLATAGIFATYPMEGVSTGTLILDQLFNTAILAMVVMAITDYSNMNVPKYLIPILVGATIFVIGISYGLNCGYPINPSRDLAPRFWTYIAGWGSGVFSVRNYNYFWIPIVIPHIGAIIGAGLYKLLFGAYFSSKEKLESIGATHRIPVGH